MGAEPAGHAGSIESPVIVRAHRAWLSWPGRIARRLLRAALVAAGVMIIAFALVRFLPGDPVLLLLGDQATPASVAEFRRVLGLNGTPPEQFAIYVGRLAQLDLGQSLVTRQDVTDIVGRTLPVTAQLVLVTIVMAVAIGTPLGTVAAIYRSTRFNDVFRVVTSVFLAIPVFFSGLLALLFFALNLHVAPVAGFDPSFPANLFHLWLPALVICGSLVPIIARVVQTSVAETLEQEFVETAIVRGLPAPRRVWRYLLRPSLAPIIGLLAYVAGQLLGTAVIVELIFDIPGIGSELVNAVLGRDYPLIQGIVLIFGFVVVIISFLADLLAGWIDPRTQVA